MVVNFNQPYHHMRRVRQQNNCYCGPAVIEMLLSFLDIQITQDQLVEAAQIYHRIRDHGMTVEEMAEAVKQLGLPVNFWYKRYSSLTDLKRLTTEFGYPVGIEWQGIFDYGDGEENSEEEEDDDDDPGHYSVLTAIDTHQNLVLLADPFRNKGKDRRLTVLEFDRRWWDINSTYNPDTKKNQEIDDYHMMFIITPKDTHFPHELGLVKK